MIHFQFKCENPIMDFCTRISFNIRDPLNLSWSNIFHLFASVHRLTFHSELYFGIAMPLYSPFFILAMWYTFLFPCSMPSAGLNPLLTAASAIMLKLTSSRQEGTRKALLHGLPSPRIKALSYNTLRDKRLLTSFWREGEAISSSSCFTSFANPLASGSSVWLSKCSKLDSVFIASFFFFLFFFLFCFFFFALLLEPLTCRDLQLWTRKLSHTKWGFYFPPSPSILHRGSVA